MCEVEYVYYLRGHLALPESLEKLKELHFMLSPVMDVVVVQVHILH